MPVASGFGPQFTRAFTSKGDWMREEPGSPIDMIASTPGRKRDGLDLRSDRWRVENYHRANGPILWQHDHKIPPLGNGRAKVGSDKLRAEVTFDQEDDFARKIESKLRRGVLNSASCGWDFVDVRSGEVLSTNRAYASTLARDAAYDLSEISIVAVPADPYATAERHWNALRSIDPRMSLLYEMQEREDSDVTGPQIRSAIIDYCTQLGLDLRYIRAASGVDNVVKDDDEYDESEVDDEDTDSEDGEGEDTEPAKRSAAPTVDQRAADAILSAFAPLVRA